MSRPASRRQFLRVGVFGPAFTLADQLRARAAGAARPKSAILVFLPGGPSHLDTWDPKPEAPAEIRGEFGSIATRVPGVRFSEHFPLQAAHFDKLAVVRSVVGMGLDHADVQVMTGYPTVVAQAGARPSFGSVVSRARGPGSGVPPFVSLRGMSAGTEPGFLGIAHRPFTPGGQVNADLRLPSDVPAGRFAERRALLAALDGPGRADGVSTERAGTDAFREQAFELVASGRVRAALSLDGEDEKTLERYSGAESLLKARRLVEAGVGCVTVSLGSWDTHKDNFKALKEQLPLLDQGVSALVQDLHERGLSREVVVLAWGEFGRTPKVNAAGGRDHWTPVMSAVLAGGGLRAGQVVGATDRQGERPAGKAYTVQQVLATAYKAIGIDPDTVLTATSGRPTRLLEDSETVRELI